MSERGTYYQLLGVRRNATSAEIRDAYVRLMKRHHPDAAPSRGGPDFSALLNRCYAVLRDPLARSRYDAQLSSLAQVPNMTGAMRWSTSRGHRPRLRLTVALLVMLAVALTSLVLLPDWERRAEEILATAAGWMSPRALPSVAGPVALPTLADSRRITGLARTSRLREAENFSRRCFANATLQGRVQTVDDCVLFDVAFLYWQKTPRASSSFPAYFADQIVESRHREAMTPFGAASEPRLNHLRRRAFLSLIEGLKTPRRMSVHDQGSVDQPLRSSDVRQGERERLDAPAVP